MSKAGVYGNADSCPALVLANGQTPVRFEPAGTGHFVLKQDALIRLLGSRLDWHQIARYDGRRGWGAAPA